MKNKCKYCKKEIPYKQYVYPKYCKNCAKIIERKQKDKWYKKNKKRVLKELTKRYSKDILFREYKKEIRKKWYLKNKQLKEKEFREYWKIYRRNHKDKKKDLARILSRKIKIPKNQLCKICKKNKAIQKHHKNYSKPLEVIFVCKECHQKIHNKY